MEPGNVLLIANLTTDWHDKDSVLLHACFTVLEKFLAEEDPFNGHIDWDRDEKHKAAKAELLALQAWWAKAKTEDRNLPDRDQHSEETEMLIRLINVRWAM